MAAVFPVLEPLDESAPAELSLGLGWQLRVIPGPRAAALRVTGPDGSPIDIEIRITAAGPVIRAAAAVLEIDAVRAVEVHCERFNVTATEQIELNTKRLVQRASDVLELEARCVSVEATAGDVRLRANDDVQVLGEQILLNCERSEPLPGWVPAAAAEVTLPIRNEQGDLDLLEPDLLEPDTATSR
jgi:hypothetical protein